MTISHRHPNCQAHNWLIYESVDRLLSAHVGFLRGAAYDLGCGESPYRDWLLRYVDSYTGVDWSSSLHTVSPDIVADLNGPLPIADAVADVVLSLSVMEHLREPRVMLGEVRRILKPGGRILLQVPFMWWVHEAPHDYYRYTRHGLQYLFEKTGFVDIRIYPQTGFWAMWILKFNYQSKRLIRGPWLARKLAKSMLGALWAIDQRLALVLDRHWKAEEETAGYFVVARTP